MKFNSGTINSATLNGPSLVAILYHLVVHNARHGHRAQTVGLALQFTLAPANTRHGHRAQIAAVTVQLTLAPQNTRHAHRVTAPAVFLGLGSTTSFYARLVEEAHNTRYSAPAAVARIREVEVDAAVSTERSVVSVPAVGETARTTTTDGAVVVSEHEEVSHE